MKKFIVVVLDGFGIGEMDDVSKCRPTDIGSNTCLHILEQRKDLILNNLEKIGLMNVLSKEVNGMKFSNTATWGKGKLTHFGADTFFGHQEIMGTRPKKPFTEPLKVKIDEIYKVLVKAGYKVRYSEGFSEKLLIVEEALTVADNIECDLGQAINITSALDIIPFKEVLKIGKLVREVVKVPRVITFGGKGITLDNILNAIEEKDGGFIGVNAPKSGVYDDGYECIHLGYGVDPQTQVTTILSENNRFICCNVQETDLAGHSENVDRYAEKLKIADSLIGELINTLKEEDILIVMADHGNDPTIGHSKHTREMVPLMITGKNIKTGVNIGERETLSDVGATVAEYFNVASPENGTSFLSKII